MSRISIKICGLTTPDQAVAVAETGVDAIGLVFYPQSPRNVDPATARAICFSLPGEVLSVGVFVDESAEYVRTVVRSVGLDAVQLHGNEPPEAAGELTRQGVLVIKAFFAQKEPGFAAVSGYPDVPVLAECGTGRLPGGNARTWDWSLARPLGDQVPLILAGGLGPDNVEAALASARPDAVDASSGVESAPGLKDLDKVRQFVDAVRRFVPEREPRRIFA